MLRKAMNKLLLITWLPVEILGIIFGHYIDHLWDSYMDPRSHLYEPSRFFKMCRITAVYVLRLVRQWNHL